MPPVLKSIAWLILGPALAVLLAWLILSAGAGGPTEGESGVSAGTLLFAGVVFVVGVFVSLIYASAALRPNLEVAGRPDDPQSPFAKPPDKTAAMDFHDAEGKASRPSVEHDSSSRNGGNQDERMGSGGEEGQGTDEDPMEPPSGFTHVGSYPLPTARRWLPHLEDRSIEFVVEMDDSAVREGDGWSASLGGTHGDGVLVHIYVRDEHLQRYAELDDEWHDATGTRH